MESQGTQDARSKKLDLYEGGLIKAFLKCAKPSLFSQLSFMLFRLIRKYWIDESDEISDECNTNDRSRRDSDSTDFTGNRRLQQKQSARPSTFALGILLLQVGLFVLFFTGVLENGNIVIFDVVWLASIVSDLVFGIREYKRNFIVSVLLLLLTSVFTMFMLLIGSI